jgi:hypothetical protein
MMPLNDRKVKAAPILSYGKMDVILMNILPLQGERLSLSEPCEENELEVGCVNWIGEAVDPPLPGRKVFNHSTIRALFIPFDRVCGALEKIMRPPGMVPNSAKGLQYVVCAGG